MAHPKTGPGTTKASSPSGTDAGIGKDSQRDSQPAVHFASGVQEIEPIQSIHQMCQTSDEGDNSMEDLTPEAKEEIKRLAMNLQKSRLQESRMSNFAFEPVSLPASRVSPS